MALTPQQPIVIEGHTERRRGDSLAAARHDDEQHADYHFLPLALAIEEGGDMLQPMAAGAVGGLLMEVLVALFLMP